MSNSNSLKILVKVGKQSKIRFSHANSMRALSVDDLVFITGKYSDCHIVVIESIASGEEKEVKQFIQSYTSKDSKNSIFFFIPDTEDNITSGIADELEYDIHLSLDSLYQAISKKYRVNVSTFLKDRKAVEEESAPDGMVIFGEAQLDEIADELAKANDSERKAEKERQAEEKREEEELKRQEEELRKQREEQHNKEIERQAEKKRKEQEAKTQSSLQGIGAGKNGGNTDNGASHDEIIRLRQQLSESNDKLIDSERRIEELELNLNEAKHENNKVIRDIKGANARIAELDRLVIVLKDEKHTIENRFNELFDRDIVIEDPISLVEYEKVQAELDEYRLKIKGLEASVEKYKSAMEEDKLTLVEKDSNINKLNDELTKLHNKIDSGEIHKEVIEQHKIEVAKLQEEKRQLFDSIQRANTEHAELTNEINRLQDGLTLEVEYRKGAGEVLSSLFRRTSEVEASLEQKLKDYNELDKKYKTLQSTYKNIQSTVETQASEATNLKSTISELEQKLSSADEYSEREINRLKGEQVAVANQLKLANEQLEQKEAQYRALVSKSGVDNDSAKSMAETNSTLETVNKTLTDKLSVAMKELNSTKFERDELSKKLVALDKKSKSLEAALQNVSLIGTGGAGASGAKAIGTGDNMIPQFRYESMATIIPVIGYGGFGVTTTAMSLASKLAMTSKVLFLDFDLVRPCADAWFTHSPYIKNPKLPPNRSWTALSIFYELGIRALMDNLNSALTLREKTKGGGIYYFAGAYNRIDSSKLATADYSGLLKLLGDNYQYIVVDMGMIGRSEVNDLIIKRFVEVSRKSVLVTIPDGFEIRSIKERLRDIGMDKGEIAVKLAWLLNKCETTVIDDKVKRQIPSAYGLITNEPGFVRNKDKFSKAKITRDKFEYFITKILFER